MVAITDTNLGIIGNIVAPLWLTIIDIRSLVLVCIIIFDKNVICIFQGGERGVGMVNMTCC